LELTPRLKTIGDSIEKCDVIADVGSDHAYLPIYLINNGKADKVIATDINVGPAEISRKRIKRFRLEDRIEVRVGDGLKVLDNDEADVIIIAGMGGLLIQSILSESLEVAKSADKIILQPMRDSRLLIKWLLDNSFSILEGKIVKEKDKYYEVIWCCYDEKSRNDVNEINEVYYYNNTFLLHEYIDKKIVQYTRIIEQMKASNIVDGEARMKECIKELNDYKEAKKWLSLNVER